MQTPNKKLVTKMVNSKTERSALPLVLERPRIGRQFSRFIKQRFMNKNGQLNLRLTNRPNKYDYYAKDYANTLVSIRWRWLIFVIILVNVFFYLMFAYFWMFDAWISGDFIENKTENFCIEGTRHFTGYLLLSIESITTTGYGYLYPTETCQLAWIILTLNTVVMIFIDGGFISIVFVKICRPLSDQLERLFSKKAVICLRNGKFCLVFRINDFQNKHVIKTEISVFLITEKNTATNETDSSKYNLNELQTDFSSLLLWPVDIVHEINSRSPLWNVSAEDLMNSRFEILVVLSGESLITGNPSVSQTSYVSQEILWGYRFNAAMDFDIIRNQYVVYDNLLNISVCDIPLCSAKCLDTIKKLVTKRKSI